MADFYTYIFSDPKTGVPRYVGKGCGRRAWRHLRKSTNPQLHTMLQKRQVDGLSCTPTIIFADSDEDAKDMEMLLIDLIGREDLGSGPLFNKTNGGDGGVKRIQTESEKEKRKNTFKQKSQHEKFAAIAAAERTRKLKTEQEKQDIFARRSEAKKIMHKTRSVEQRARMTSILAEASHKPCTIDFVKIYPTRKALAEELGQGKSGTRSPNFRYLTPEEIKTYGTKN